MEHMALHLNLGLVTKGVFALPKSSPGEAKQYEKGLDPLCGFFLYSHLYLPLLGFFFLYIYISSLFCKALTV